MNIRETKEYKEFLSALRNTPRDWFLRFSSGSLRRGERHGYLGSNTFCPLTAVFGNEKVNFLSERFYWEIANAADGESGSLSTDFNAVRKDLLEACGLA